jgi:hypothetical protein
MSDPVFLPLEYYLNNRSDASNVIDRYLNEKIDLTGRNIALSYIHFYDVFRNVSQANENAKLKYVAPNQETYEVIFPDGTYTYRDYNNYLHFQMKRNGHFRMQEMAGTEIYGISIAVNTVLNVLSFRIEEGYILLIEDDGTSEFLGVHKGEYATNFNGQIIPNITMSNDTMFVHCNVVDNSIIPEVNDVIFTCPINKYFGQHVNIVPNEKRYLKCTNAHTQTIKITLTTQAGAPLTMTERKWGIGLDIR